MGKEYVGFSQFKANVTLELLVKLSPELEWKVHANGSWYSCNDFAQGGGHLLAVKRLEIQAENIGTLVTGLKLHAEAVYNNVADAVDEWRRIFDEEYKERIEKHLEQNQSKEAKHLEPEQSKEANPGSEINVLKKAEKASTRDVDDRRPY